RARPLIVRRLQAGQDGCSDYIRCTLRCFAATAFGRPNDLSAEGIAAMSNRDDRAADRIFPIAFDRRTRRCLSGGEGEKRGYCDFGRHGRRRCAAAMNGGWPVSENRGFWG